MNIRTFFAGCALSVCLLPSCQEAIQKEKEPLTPVSFEKVTLQDEFWLPRLKTQKQTLVPFALEKAQPQ